MKQREGTMREALYFTFTESTSHPRPPFLSALLTFLYDNEWRFMPVFNATCHTCQQKVWLTTFAIAECHAMSLFTFHQNGATDRLCHICTTVYIAVNDKLNYWL